MSARIPSDRSEVAAFALAVAEEAGVLVRSGYRSKPRPEHKGPRDLVTEFDRASEALLVGKLAAYTPGVPIVAEESTEGREGARSTGPVWYIDPLDGTTNFVHGHPFWSVAVGLMVDGEPVVGAVVAPMLDVRWAGWLGRAGGVAQRNGEACKVSSCTRLDEALVGTGFPPVRDTAPGDNFGSFIAVKRIARGVRRCGSAAIDLCLVADGTYDGFWERSLHAWDVVAASAIALGAGGRVTALDGSAPDYHAGNVVVSNQLIHAELLSAIRAGESHGGR